MAAEHNAVACPNGHTETIWRTYQIVIGNPGKRFTLAGKEIVYRKKEKVVGVKHVTECLVCLAKWEYSMFRRGYQRSMLEREGEML